MSRLRPHVLTRQAFCCAKRRRRIRQLTYAASQQGASRSLPWSATSTPPQGSTKLDRGAICLPQKIPTSPISLAAICFTAPPPFRRQPCCLPLLRPRSHSPPPTSTPRVFPSP